MNSIFSKLGIRLLFKMFSFIFCATGLLYQSSQLLSQYLSGKTYASIKIGKIFNDTLPALTICSFNFFSASKLSGFNPDLDKLHEEYFEASKSWSGNYYDSWLEQNLSSVRSKIGEHYFKITMNKSLAIIEIFNFTLPFNFDGNNLINIKLVGKVDYNINNDMKFVEISTKKNMFKYAGSPIESITYYPSMFQIKNQFRFISENKKCFTFFSWLDEFWRHFTIDLEQINIEFEHDKGFSSIYQNSVMYSLAIHSPNSLPELNSYPRFDYILRRLSSTYKYHQVHIDLFKPQYDTNCFEYDLDYKFANNNMRSDCITHCYQDAKRKKCNTHGIIPSWYLLRKQIFLQDKSLKFTDSCNDQDNVINDCMIRCKNDCKFKYYLIEQSPIPGDIKNKTEIIIEHSQLPDIKIEHLPEVTFILFVCNFGGLLGMWCGLSVLAMFNSINILLVNFIDKRKITNVNVFNNTNSNNDIPIFVKSSGPRRSISRNSIKNQDIPIQD